MCNFLVVIRRVVCICICVYIYTHMRVYVYIYMIIYVCIDTLHTHVQGPHAPKAGAQRGADAPPRLTHRAAPAAAER